MAFAEAMMNRPANKFRQYLSTSLGDFYAFGVNRLMLYCLLTCFFMLAGFLAWMVYISPHFLIKRMAFSTVYVLHNAVAYTLCLYLVDVLANRFWPAWAGYEKRTVGRQWAIWSGGFVLGFILHRTVVRSLVYVYASQALTALSNHPGFPPSHLTFALAMPPFWALAIAAVIQVALKRQQAQQQSHASAIKAMLSNAAKPVPARQAADSQAVRDKDDRNSLGGALALKADAGEMKIPHAQITRITVEDHYSRIFFASGNGDSLRNVLIRLPLKRL